MTGGCGQPSRGRSRSPHHPVLLAEDDPITQTLFLRMLKVLGYDADVAGDGQAALDAIRARPYAIVLLDLHMPLLDGIDVIQAVRRLGVTIRQPFVIALTASAVPSERERCMAAGMDGYVAKPVTLEQLGQALRAAAGHAPDGPAAEVVGAVGSPAALNESTWTRLRVQLGAHEQQFVATIVPAYCAEARQLIGALAAALNRADPIALRDIAHRLKSSSAMVGADRLAALCEQLEWSSAAGHETLQPLIAAIGAEFDAVRQALGLLR